MLLIQPKSARLPECEALCPTPEFVTLEVGGPDEICPLCWFL